MWNQNQRINLLQFSLTLRQTLSMTEETTVEVTAVVVVVLAASNVKSDFVVL